jgi:hypothetical protein
MNASWLQRFLQSSPATALAAVKSWIDSDHASARENWLGLADAAGTRAVSAVKKDRRDDALGWAAVHVLVKEQILCVIDPRHQVKHEMSAMMMRISMIRAYGADSNDPVRYSKAVAMWGLDYPRLSLDEAKRYRDHATLAPELRVRLESAHDHLAVLSLLQDVTGQDPTPEITQALELWNALKA